MKDEIDGVTNHAEAFARRQEGTLVAELGIQWNFVGQGRAEGWFEVEPRHMAPNGYIHAASVIALADSAAGFGCIASLPDGADVFTTIELKSNFLGSGVVGDILVGEARLAHGGRTTQVWDAVVTNQRTAKTVALFRCTQMILYPRA